MTNLWRIYKHGWSKFKYLRFNMVPFEPLRVQFILVNFMCFDIHFREKLYEISFKNPIKDGILRKCPQMADELEDPYAKRLDGSEILNILCEEKCDRLQDIKPMGKLIFESKYL